MHRNTGVKHWTVVGKEYILVIERTAPPSVFQTCVSPNLSPCSVRESGSWSGVLYVYYRQSRKRLGETHVWKTQRDAVHSITNIYSLIVTIELTNYFFVGSNYDFLVHLALAINKMFLIFLKYRKNAVQRQLFPLLIFLQSRKMQP